MNITKDFISSVSANDAAVKNGVDLVKKKSFKNLVVDKDKTFISGECAGSGKNPYVCSADFINENTPVFRCTCPSRQIPCKHSIGLMWAYMDGQKFNVAEVPDEIREKRENKEKRAEKAKEKLENAEKSENNEPKEKSAAWKKSAVKKIEAQLTGIEEAGKILQSITQSGLGSMDAKNIKNYSDIVKQLDSYFIPGIQNEIKDLLGMAGDRDAKEQSAYMHTAEKLCQIHTLLARSKAYLENKKEAPDKMDTESEIEELMGYAWKLEELAQQGLFETDARLLELCFHVRQEDDKKQFVDEGFYISLNSGKIFKTRNYRPFKAAKYIREEDSVFSVLRLPKLYIYPSNSMNPRIRWEENTLNMFERILPEDYKLIKSYAQTNYAEVIKIVKNQLKNLLLFPYPAILVSFAKISKIAEKLDDTDNSSVGKYVIYDSSNNAICLKQSGYFQNSFMFLLDKLTKAEAENNALLLLFDNNVETGELFAQPLALVTGEKIVRLVF
jgi:hypothetical protein